jgi:hypothetical protein
MILSYYIIFKKFLSNYINNNRKNKNNAIFVAALTIFGLYVNRDELKYLHIKRNSFMNCCNHNNNDYFISGNIDYEISKINNIIYQKCHFCFILYQ